ncbi:MAG: glycoside hydrolase family 3 protein [Planctomycetota bacterium]
MIAPLTDAQQRWVDTTFDELTRRERIAQLIVPTLTPDTAAPLSIADYVATTGIGGGHLFGGPVETVRELAAEAQQAAKVPLLLTGDFEAGCGPRIREAVAWPGEMALGAAGDEALAGAMGASIAAEATGAGYNWAFGPIVDLAAVKDYQRQVDSYGRDPQAVARLAVAQIEAMQAGGLAACAKHFPGDGFDDRDQHLMTLVNPLTAEDWWANSAVPFQAAIEAGVWSIMVSCIGLPSLDGSSGDPRNPTPAVVSRPLITDLLRRRMGFEGVIVSDALNMGGVSYRHRQLDRYRLALAAGNDVILFVRDVQTTLDYLERCVEQGDLEAEAIDAAARSVLSLKARLGLDEQRMVDGLTCGKVYRALRGQDDADRLAERSVTLVRDSAGRVPLGVERGATVAVVLITNQEAERFEPDAFVTALEKGGCKVTLIRDPQTDAVYDRVANGEFDVVVTAFYYPVQYGWNTTRIHGPTSRCVMSGFPIAHPDTTPVWISFSNPYHLYELPFMDPYLVTYSPSPASQRAAAGALLGRTPITGKLPCDLDGFWSIGDGIRREE